MDPMHISIINQQRYTIFSTVAKAEAVLPESDEDLHYEVVPDPKGSCRAVIKVYDAETGSFIGNL
jgi:hypothetical protein